MAATTLTNFRLSDEIRGLLEQLAERNDTSQPSLIAMLVRDRARQEGLLPPLVKTEPELPVVKTRKTKESAS